MSFFEQTQLEDLFTGFHYREPCWGFEDKEFYLIKGDMVYPSFDNNNWAIVFPFLFKRDIPISGKKKLLNYLVKDN
jgi:hypothetical protein